jgi:hypothetical protein
MLKSTQTKHDEKDDETLQQSNDLNNHHYNRYNQPVLTYIKETTHLAT